MSTSEPPQEADLSEGTQLALEALDPPAAPATPPTFYRLNLNNCTLREWWWGTPLPVLFFPLIFLLFKVLRLRVPCSADDPCVEHLGDFEVPESKVPQVVRDRFATLAAELAALGFHSPIYHSIDDYLHKTGTLLASYAHPSLPVIARIHQRVWALNSPAKVKIYVEFITAYSDGGFLWTLAGKHDMVAPRVCKVTRREKATIAQLWEHHQQERVKDSAFRKALPTSTPDQVAVICEHLHDVVREFHVQRGVFVPQSRADQQEVASTRELFQKAASGRSENPDVMVELDKLLAPRTSWVATALLLLVSLGLFVAWRPRGTSTWLAMLGIVGVLFFHELGHYVTMKLCGYKNLRMFFLPGLGAAVSGQAFNVPGWKRVIVALMGPIPGIILGIVVGLCGMVLHRDLAIGAGLLLVAINGFNLLPIFPLDGGRVLHAILFSRHYVPDIVFRVLTVMVFMVVSVAMGSRVGVYVGIPILMTIPLTIRTAQIAKKLRQEGLSPLSRDNQTIPRDVADKIITHLKAGGKKPVHNKILAQQTLQVFETLNTRPPGVLASLSLLSVHGLMLITAIAFTVVFISARQGTLGGFIQAAANRPHHKLVPADIHTTSVPPAAAGTPTPAPSADPIKHPANATVVATFPRSAQAAEAYAKAVPTLGPGQSATLLGNTLLLRAPAADESARKQWMNTLGPGSADLFVQGEAMAAGFRIQAVAPTEEAAKEIETQLKDYFALPLYELVLIAPWTPSCTLTREQQVARRTYLKLSGVVVYSDPQFKASRDKIDAARRAGDTAQVKSLTEESRKLSDELMRKGFQAVADDPAMDRELALRYAELYAEKPENVYLVVPKELGPRMGQADPAGPDPLCAAAAAHGGWMMRTGVILEIGYVNFEDPSEGAAALARWLSSRGVSQLHYEVHAVTRGADEEE